MKTGKMYFYFLTIALALFIKPLSIEAAIMVKNGKIMDADEVATFPVDEHFRLGQEAFQLKDWDEAAKQFYIVTRNFPNTSFAQDSYFYLGVAYYHLKEYDFANEEFSSYLKVQSNPKYFQETIEYKLQIADRFRDGARRRLLGYKRLPKWASGRTMASAIYDEVITALPCHEIAAKALYSKACLLWDLEEYRDSVEAFQVLIRRFPKNELAPESYLAISRLYVEQSETEFQNPDILAFAQLNLRRFSQDFPREERLKDVESDVARIKEIYANGLFETAQFYERTKKSKASEIYYKNAIKQFPDTSVAERCRQRLNELQPEVVDRNSAG